MVTQDRIRVLIVDDHAMLRQGLKSLLQNYGNVAVVGEAADGEAWRRELAGRGVRVSLVLPAAVETEFLDKAGRDRALGKGPAGIVLAPDAVARAIVRALERHPADVYLPRRNRFLALVDAALPGISDRILRRLLRYPPSA